jgi:hypothetical protein
MSEKKMINEIGDTPEGQFMLGRVQGRQNQRARGEQTTGRIKQTTIHANDYWGGTDFTHGENFEDPQSWRGSWDVYDKYGDFDSDAYHRNIEEREQDQESEWELYSSVQDKLNKKIKNESKNMNRKNTIKLTEGELKKIISESVKKVLKESEEYMPWWNSGVQNELDEINRITRYLINEYLDVIPQEQLDNLGDVSQKYRQFLSNFMKQIDSKRW